MQRFAMLALALAVLALAAHAAPAPGGVGNAAAMVGEPAARFAADGTTPELPFDLVSNHVCVDVRVNGSGPFAFVLDSGASTILDARCAERLGLASAKAKGGSGVGAQHVDASTLKEVSLSLPGVELRERGIAVTDLSAVEKALGRAVDGILGASVFRKAVVVLDYEKRVMRLADPKAFRYAGGGAAVPLVVSDDLVFVRATVKPKGRDPIAGLFEVDSGGGHAVILNTPFVAKNRLEPAGAVAGAAGGLGGRAPVAVGRLDWIEIGGLRVDGPTTIFARATSGMLASDEFAGNVGGEVLGRFRVTFDYSRERLYLEGPAR